MEMPPGSWEIVKNKTPGFPPGGWWVKQGYVQPFYECEAEAGKCKSRVGSRRAVLEHLKLQHEKYWQNKYGKKATKVDEEKEKEKKKERMHEMKKPKKRKKKMKKIVENE